MSNTGKANRAKMTAALSLREPRHLKGVGRKEFVLFSVKAALNPKDEEHNAFTQIRAGNANAGNRKPSLPKVTMRVVEW